LLQADFENGFICSDCSMFLEGLLPPTRHFPLRGVLLRVTSVLNLRGGSSSILSTTEVHQEDPFGSFLFSATMHPMVESLEEVKGWCRTLTWFLEAWDILVMEGVHCGLHQSREKSLVFCPEHNPQDQDPLGRGVTRVERKGIKLLGEPVAEQEIEAEILEERVVSLQHLLDSLHLLDDPHMEYTPPPPSQLLRPQVCLQPGNSGHHPPPLHPGELCNTAVQGAL
jgi:hypothetical protein